MNPRLQLSRTAIDLIKRFEGYRRTAAQLPDGGWTIGYGHTRSARAGAQVSEADAEALLIYDLIDITHALNEHIYAPLTQNQFDALASFAFNIGVPALRTSSVLLRLNEGALLQAASAMELWRRAEFEGDRIVVDTLVRRRAAEKALFLTPEGGAWAPAPSPVLRPMLDAETGAGLLREAPATLEAPLDGDSVTPVRTSPPPPQPVHTPLSLHRPAVFLDEEAPAEEPAPTAGWMTAPLSIGDGAPRFPLRSAPIPRAAIGPMVILALLGAVLFAGGLYWTFDIAPAAHLSRAGALTVGWIAGLAGVGFFSLAAYRLLQRLVRDDDAS
ncbi:MAG: lysozyme [Phenylobacterium sp.]|uniref:lysozyme n=1 Tax=Phenylobacterium sp. TaxID=1871053 RepID=UPI0027374940|nr:lysozyme [Phenylobacterium sp.]MDP3173253.1 lysozyme [Phenylobacterium sp.]